MYDVLTYLDNHTDLQIWNPTTCRTFREGVPFHFSLRSLGAMFYWNLWAIIKMRKLPRGSIILISSYLKQQFFIFLWTVRYIKRYKILVMVNALYFRSRKSKLLNLIDKILMILFLIPANQVVCNSNGTSKEIINLGINSNKISVVYPSVVLPPDIPVESLSNSHKYQIAFVGNVTPFKKLHLLIEALGNLSDIPWTLKVAGDMDRDHEYIERIQRLIRGHVIEAKVNFLDRLEGENLTRLYKTSHVLISPGSGEGFGRVVIEAMYFGCPVIGASCEATSELISDGQNGILFEKDNARSLEKKIRYLYENPQGRKNMSQMALKFARSPIFYQNIGQRYYSIIRSLAKSNIKS